MCAKSGRQNKKNRSTWIITQLFINLDKIFFWRKTSDSVNMLCNGSVLIQNKHCFPLRTQCGLLMLNCKAASDTKVLPLLFFSLIIVSCNQLRNPFMNILVLVLLRKVNSYWKTNKKTLFRIHDNYMFSINACDDNLAEMTILLVAKIHYFKNPHIFILFCKHTFSRHSYKRRLMVLN